MNAIQALSQLSYTPMGKMYIIRHAAKCQEFFSRVSEGFENNFMRLGMILYL